MTYLMHRDTRAPYRVWKETEPTLNGEWSLGDHVWSTVSERPPTELMGSLGKAYGVCIEGAEQGALGLYSPENTQGDDDDEYDGKGSGEADADEGHFE